MTKEEAWRRTKGYLYDVLSGEEADEIIKALDKKLCDDMEREYEKAKALFDKVVKSKDCISRHDVKMIIINEMEGFPTDEEISQLKRLWKQFEKLPSVTPQEPKKGHWIKLDEYYKCSECSLVTSESGKLFYNYCPNCGAKIESEV